MPAFEITLVSDKIRPWDSTKGGPMKSYRIQVKDEQGNITDNVEWARKADSPAPAVGQKIEGTLDTSGEYGPKFKATPTSSFGGRGGRSPQERAEIIQQHSHKVALEYARLQNDRGKLPDDFNLDQILVIAGKFAADAKAAKP